MALKRPGSTTVIDAAETTTQENLPATTAPTEVGFSGGFEDFDTLKAGGTLHYVKMDGTEWVIGGFDEEIREKTVEFVLSAGRLYFYNRDTQEEIPYRPGKEPAGFALRSEVIYYDWVEGSDEPHEFHINLPKVSTFRFKEYLEALKKQGRAPGACITRAKVVRTKNKENQIFSQAEFEYVGPAETQE